jgi:DNA mismatch repair protein MutL
MGKISILPDNLCNQIAAGEVIERPAAVVKELVENSIDAGSRKVWVSLLQGGREEIRVVDNGSGMSSDDALMALERHATSKIKSLDDLQLVESLGFRGEALPSIASVSRFELTTKETAALSGTYVRIEAGVLRDVRETGCAAGTSIRVRDLFHNVPVRRKFLRSVDTEMANVADQFLRLSLAHPNIHFQLSHQERVTYDLHDTKDYLQRVLQVIGPELMESLAPFAVESPPYALHGFVGSHEVQRSNTRSMFINVNGRPVWDRLLNQSILRAYDTLLPKGKFPVVVLFLKMPPQTVDVNVHPTKREIRVREPGRVADLIQNTLVKTLRAAQFQCRSDPEHFAAPPDITLRTAARGIRETQDGLENRFDGAITGELGSIQLQTDFPYSAYAHAGMGEQSDSTPERTSGAARFFSRLPVFGQLANTYILLEASDALILIDQHAVHERILYDQLSASEPGESGRQRLTRSVILELLPREAAILLTWLDQLIETGFEIESFGQHSFKIQAVPAALSAFSPDALLRQVLETAEEDQQKPNWDLLAGITKTASCHGAIKAGQRLQREEIVHLLETMDRVVHSATCPHGRPLWIKISHAEIARLFKRS